VFQLSVMQISDIERASTTVGR